ncbi:transcriptional regulator [Candidatus Bathyarchaeota archaeon]|nr:MAG: transcriptional regulator [Candidatus Bathyarchaeota archaeon]
MKKSETVICQSCGMPMKQDGDFGTNRNCSKSKEYCMFCFKEGQFTDEGITLVQKIEKNIMIAKGMGISEVQAKRMAEKVIPTLKNWRDK